MRNERQKVAQMSLNQPKPFPASLLLELFPFGFLINPSMKIMGAGEKLMDVWKGKDSLLGRSVTKHFRLRRPKGITFSWKNVKYFAKN